MVECQSLIVNLRALIRALWVKNQQQPLSILNSRKHLRKSSPSNNCHNRNIHNTPQEKKETAPGVGVGRVEGLGDCEDFDVGL